MSEKPLEQMGLRDLRKSMRRKAPAEAWKHFNGAAETKATFRRNPRAFHQYLFRQKIFHDVAEPDIAIELFGHTLPLPAMTAPVGSFSLIGKDAERQVAEGTGRAGAMMFVSQAAKFAPKDWRDAAKSPLVFLAYMNRGQGRSFGVCQNGGGSRLRRSRHYHGYCAAGQDRRRSAAVDEGRQAAQRP
jgi:L-lactate dehydrogenase (cytochrome)